MVEMSKRSVLILCVVCLAVGWQGAVQLSPSTKSDRPVLRAIARMAKSLLWVAAFTEPAPKDPYTNIQSVLLDDQGYVHLNHARGW